MVTGAALVFDRRAMADFRVYRNLVHAAVIVPHEQGNLDAVADFQRAGKPGETPPKWESCLWDEKTAREITCKQQWSTAEIATFRAALHPVLVSLACESTAAAKGFIRQVDQTPDIDPGDSPRWGLTQKLAARINDPLCPGLYTMTPADKDELVILAKRDAEGAPTPQSQGRRR